MPAVGTAAITIGKGGSMRDLWFWLTTLVLVVVVMAASWAILIVVLRPMLPR